MTVAQSEMNTAHEGGWVLSGLVALALASVVGCGLSLVEFIYSATFTLGRFSDQFGAGDTTDDRSGSALLGAHAPSIASSAIVFLICLAFVVRGTGGWRRVSDPGVAARVAILFFPAFAVTAALTLAAGVLFGFGTAGV